jgi:Sec-independent protein translocase protein TatA
MVYQDTPTNCILIFTDKIMSLAVPAKEMVQQYRTAIKELAHYLEEEEFKSLENDFDEEPKSLDDWLDEMKEESTEDEELDSDVDGMLMN